VMGCSVLVIGAQRSLFGAPWCLVLADGCWLLMVDG
jgi:hypothetical protein